MSSHLAISFTCYYFLPKILCSVFFLNFFCRRDHFTHGPTLSIWCIEVLVFPLVLWLLQLLGQGLLFQHSLCLQMNLLFPLIGSMPTLGNLTWRYLHHATSILLWAWNDLDMLIIKCLNYYITASPKHRSF